MGWSQQAFQTLRVPIELILNVLFDHLTDPRETGRAGLLAITL